MLGLLLYEFASTEGRLRIDKFIRAEGRATLLALVTVSALRTTTRPGSGDISVCKEGLCLLVIILFAYLFNELALILKLAEIVCRILMVSLR